MTIDEAIERIIAEASFADHGDYACLDCGYVPVKLRQILSALVEEKTKELMEHSQVAPRASVHPDSLPRLVPPCYR
jgi:hypothetical protein